jgi:hypothetical protein
MPRLVVPTDATKGKFASKTIDNVPADDYKDRLVKYIPAESVAFYALVDKVVASHYKLEGSPLTTPVPEAAIMLSWLIFGIGVIGTPFYLKRQKLPGQPWKLHAGISTIAFVLWAYTLSGTVFLIYGWYSVFMAGLLAPIFTFIAGFIEPKPE